MGVTKPEEILFRQFKNLIPTTRIPEYVDWFHKKFPDKEMHHLTGSLGPLKLHDCFAVPVTREQHTKAHEDMKLFFMDNIAYAVQLFFLFLKETNRL